MVAVPLSEQRPVTLPGPGINAAFQEQQAEPILVSTATTINAAVAAGPTAGATVAGRQSPVVAAVATAERSTSIASASTEESVVLQSGVATASTTAVAAAEATTSATAVAEDQRAAISDTESAITVVETQSASKVERLSTAAVHTEASGSSMLASTSSVDTVAMTSLASIQQHVYTSSDQSKADAVVESKAESSLLVSHLSSEQIKAHRSSQGLDVASDDDPIEALDSTQADVQEQNSMSESRLQADLSTTTSGVPLLAQRPGSKLEQMHSALRTQL